MITRFVTDVATVFNPFSPKSRTARIFLAYFPASSRTNIKFTTKMLPRSSKEKSTLELKFKDGKHMSLDAEKLSLKDIIEEVDRHSRVLARKEDLGN